MKKSIRDNWIQALRSGKYKQGKGKLCKLDKFCCLGVLLDVNNESYFINEKEQIRQYDLLENVLSTKLQTKYGLDVGQHNSLAQLNDGVMCEPMDFLEIADWIEKNIPTEQDND